MFLKDIWYLPNQFILKDADILAFKMSCFTVAAVSGLCYVWLETGLTTEGDSACTQKKSPAPAITHAHSRFGD